MKDFLGFRIVEGDNIVYLSHGSTSSQYVLGKVIGFTPKMVKVKIKSRYSEQHKETTVDSHKLIVINKITE